jgi:hypothetical protein
MVRKIAHPIHQAEWLTIIRLAKTHVFRGAAAASLGTVLGHKFKSEERFRAKGALSYTIYLL